MKIRNYEDKDIKFISKIGEKLHRNYEFKLDTFSKCLVCEQNNDIIGFVTYSIIYERAEIVDIIIVEDHRRLGYGIELLNEVINRCINEDVLNITLEVDQSNTSAFKFYSKLGFTVVATRPNYYEKGTKDAYIMEKKLR